MRLLRALLLVAAGTLASAAAQAQDVPAPREVVAPAAFVSMEPAARGQSVQIAVVLKVRPGYHINARPASFEYLIPTDVKTEFPSGFKAGEVSYPKGTRRTFSFTKTPLNVYEGTVILRLPVQIAGDAPLGEQTLPLRVRYQACNDQVCLPPVTVPVSATLKISASAQQARPAHRELFR